MTGKSRFYSIYSNRQSRFSPRACCKKTLGTLGKTLSTLEKTVGTLEKTKVLSVFSKAGVVCGVLKMVDRLNTKNDYG